MSNIFISHSWVDNHYAKEVIDYLKQIGHKSLYLDFDPNHGTPPGRNWEKEIYANLHKCQVVIALYSKSFSSSYWCFAEITHAKALGKYIIPLKINDCTINNILSDIQVIDATTNLSEAFQRLQSGLLAAGVNKEGWDYTRPPYPGLFAFQEEDAPIFFGREEETENLLKSLRQFRSFGGPKLLLVLGASGSGKSSLIRAGVIPHLRKDKRSWIIIGPFRPLKKPFEELSKSLAVGFNQFKDHRSWEDIYNSLKVDSGNAFEIAKSLSRSLAEIIKLSIEKSITLLLFIDQLEELLFDNYNTGNEQTEENTTHLFLSSLRLFLDSSDSNFFIISTLRSDFLVNFQEKPSLKGLTYDGYLLKSVNAEGLRASIAEPAKLAGIEFQDGLVEVILKDTGTPDALPLLAFTLRELYEQYGKDGLLEIEEYRNKLGGLEGSVAKVAEAVLISYIAQTGRGVTIREENHENKANLNREDENLLKAAFMAMVRIDEDGRYTRRIPKWEELPGQITNLLQRFVTARLLIISGNGKDVKIEVAHEALFRTWKRLIIWLEENKNFLIWRKRLNTALDEWQRSKRNESELLSGPALVEAVQWLNQFKSGKYNLTNNEIEFINASHKETEKQRLKKLKNSRFLFSGLGIVFITVSFLLLIVLKNSVETESKLAINYWNSGITASAKNNFLDALHLGAEALNLFEDEDSIFVRNLLIDMEPYLSQTNLQNIYLHSNRVFSAAFSPDGKQVLTAGLDSTARLWEAASAKPIGYPMKHKDRVDYVVFSLDGKKVLTASFDSTARLWDAASAKPIGHAMKHNDRVNYAVFSPDGKQVLTSSWDSTARIWEAASGKPIGHSLKHKNKVYSAVFSPDGKQVLTACLDSTARLWEVASGEPIGTALKHESAVVSAVFSPDGKRVLTGSFDSTARLWDAASGESIGSHMKHENFIHSAVFSPNGKQILTASRDNTAHLWEAGSGKPIGQPMKHEDVVYFAVFSPDGTLVLTASEDNTARLWYAVSGDPIGPALKHEGAVNYAVFSPNGKRVLTAGNDNTARLWETSFSKPIVHSLKHKNKVYSAVFTPDGKKVLTASGDNTATLWEAASGKPIGHPLKHKDRVNHAVFSPDGKQVLTASSDSTAQLWETESGKAIGSAMKHKERVYRAVFSPDGKKVLTAVLDSTARLWEAVSGKPIGDSMKHKGGVTSVVFSKDGTQILTACLDGHLYVWEAASCKPIGDPTMVGEGSALYSAVLNPDETLILIAGWDKTARFWEEGKQRGPALKHEGSVTSAVFSPDGSLVLTASRDKTARLWEATSGKPRGLALKHEGGVTSAVFSPDGKQVLTSFDSTARLWLVASDLDIPIKLFKLQAKVNTGVELIPETGKLHCIPSDQWHKLKEEYNIKARKHYETCKYREYNLWARFFPEEAKKISSNE